MSITLLQTKLCRPDVGSVVYREDLTNALSDFSHQKLTLLHAPAGYGKTTLVSSWLQTSQMAYAWLSLDAKNNIPSSFWLYFCEALRKFDDSIVEDAAPLLLQSSRLDYCDVVDVLLQGLVRYSRKWHRPEKIIFVLDDFHFIAHDAILESLNRFIDYMPSWLNVVITTRQLPELKLAGRYAKKEANELGAQFLAFDREMLSKLLPGLLNIGLSDQEQDLLIDKTEGWIAAIQLVLLSMRSGGRVDQLNLHHLSPQQPFLSDFFFDEVYSQLSLSMQVTLLNLSTVGAFCEGLLSDICDSPDTYREFQPMLNSQLFFTVMDEGEKWFRLHALFREWLLGYAKVHANEQLNKARKKALSWFEEHGYYEEAVEQAILLEDWSKAGMLVQQLYPSLVRFGQFDLLESLLEGFPESVIQSMPHLSTLKAVICFNAYDYESVERYLSLAETALESSKQGLCFGLLNPCDIGRIDTGIKLLKSQTARFRGDTALASALSLSIQKTISETDYDLLCWTYYGLATDDLINDKITSAIDKAFIALSLAKKANDGLCVIGTLAWLIHALVINGQLRYAEKVGLENLDWLIERSLDALPNISSFYCALAILYKELNQMDRAWEFYQLAEPHFHQYAEPREILYGNYFVPIQLWITELEFDKARARMRDMQHYVRTSSSDFSFTLVPDLRAIEGWVELAAGNVSPLIAWAESELLLDSHHCPLRLENERILYAIAQMIKGKPVDTLLSDLQREAEANGATSRLLEVHLLQSRMHFLAGDMPQSAQAFFDALHLAAPLEFASPFVSAGRVISPLLEQAILMEIEPEFSRLLLERLSANVGAHENAGSLNSDDKIKRGADPTVARLVDTLTGREVEVLTLVGKGCSNKETAERLSLSPSTVKRHMQNIFGKLAVKNRVEALVKAQEVGLIEG